MFSGRSARWVRGFGHRSPGVLLGLLPVSCALTVGAPLVRGRVVVDVVFLLVLFAVGVAVAAAVVHDRAVCAACWAVVPLDGAVRAGRSVERLRLFHAVVAPSGVGALLFLGACAYVLEHPWREVGALVVCRALWVVARVVVVHRALEPWCGGCRWGGGGEGPLPV